MSNPSNPDKTPERIAPETWPYPEDARTGAIASWFLAVVLVCVFAAVVLIPG